ncbi:MAG: hypothetical protein K5799_13440 [Erythrobacter sp.]|nr:hypothetical protein [Erythrobacter sp.]
MISRLQETWVFASDAEIMTIAALGLIGFAGLALFMDRRRLKRGHIERVGWMPWTPVFLLAAIAGAGMLALAAPALLAA